MHPTLVLVPLTAWGSAKVFDDIGDRPAAQAVIGAGVLAAIPTAITDPAATAVSMTSIAETISWVSSATWSRSSEPGTPVTTRLPRSIFGACSVSVKVALSV